MRRSAVATRVCRAGEALFSNRDYKRGVAAYLKRHVPFGADFVASNLRTARVALTSITGGYLINKLFYGVSLPLPMWTFAMMTYWTVSGPEMTLTRGFAMQGWRQGGSIWMVALFGFVYSWATFGGTPIQQVLQGDFQRAWDRFISRPIDLVLKKLLPRSMWPQEKKAPDEKIWREDPSGICPSGPPCR